MSSSSDPNNPQTLTDKKKAENEIVDLLNRMSLATGAVKAPERKAAGTIGAPTKIDTNVYQVQTGDRVVYRYDVTVAGKSRGGREVDLTKRSESSAIIAGRTSACRDAFLAVFAAHSEFFGTEDRNTVYYDLQSILYTLAPLNIGAGKQEVALVVEQSSEQGAPPLPGNLSSITMIVKNVREVAQQIRLDDMSALINSETLERDRSLLNFIELAVNQHPMFATDEFLTLNGSMAYLLNGSHYGLDDKGLDRNGTKYLAAGVQKSAALIEGFKKPDSDPNQRRIGLLLEAKHSPFHSVMGLIDCISKHDGTSSLHAGFCNGALNESQLQQLTKIFRKMYVTVRYPNRHERRIAIQDFAEETATSCIIGDLNTNVADYYVAKHKQQLRYPHAHLVRSKETDAKGKKQINFYPPEILFIADNQVVTAEQMDAASKAAMIRTCAVRPDQMKPNNSKAAQAIRLHDAPATQAADIRCSKETLNTNGRILPPPSIQYAGGRAIQVQTSEAAWRVGNFLAPGNCENYAIYLVANERGPQMTENDMRAFIQEVQSYARRFNMNIGQLMDQGIYLDTQVEECIEHCHKNNIKLCLFITPENIKTCHKVMKACEHKYNVITQDLKLMTAKKMLQRGAATSENYISKTNIKLGGLNHAVQVRDPATMNELKSTLFVGIATNQPGSKTAIDRVQTKKEEKPGVLGYAANTGKDYNEFIGDFHYTVAYRPEFFGDLRDVFQVCVERFAKNRGVPPVRVLFYYTGLTEGQFENAYKFAVPLIKDGIRQANNGTDIPLTMIAAHKMNNIRLFPTNMPQNARKDHEVNIPHGTVVDTTIVHPVFSEFYLAPHSALKGTARVPRYTIVVDESNYTMDVLEGVTHALAYEHQIVGRATALPTPIYVAEDYARRGRDVFNAEERQNPAALPRLNDDWDFKALTSMLNYSQSDLFDKRVNA